MQRLSLIPTLAEIERLFDALNAELFDNRLPIPVITLQENEGCKGWFMHSAWRKKRRKKMFHEINICPSRLAGGPYSVCETLLHEMVHLHCFVNGINDCSEKQYHNKSFKQECERVGLHVSQLKGFGWAETRLSKPLRLFLRTVEVDHAVFNICYCGSGEHLPRGNK
jgi:hypothetical protein